MTQPSDDFQSYPLIDSIDHEILMHRDAHFGGLFPDMLEYYQQQGKGIQPDFQLERIVELARLEQQLNQNLAAVYLEGYEMEKIAESKAAYKVLRAIYEIKNPKTLHPRLLADLILAEEEEPTTEIEAVVAEKEKIVPALMHVLKSEEFYDPLFPGYGLAPALAAKCLGLIGDKRAIMSLFESIGQGDFFSDEQVLKALKQIGDPAKEFLLKVVAGHPFNEDNEKAAIALIQFKEDPQVAEACFKLLQDLDVQKDPCLPTYLVLACEGLKETPYQVAFEQWAQSPHLSRALREDAKAMMQEW